jgi:hypothetical protein
MNSLMLFAGTEGCVIRNTSTRATEATGTRSFSASKGIFVYRNGFTVTAPPLLISSV